jgi:hypothetical protein
MYLRRLWRTVRLEVKTGRFPRRNTPFHAENLQSTPSDWGRGSLISFLETSDFKALQRIFLPTSRSRAQIAPTDGAERLGDAPSRSGGRGLQQLFRFRTSSAWVPALGRFSYPMRCFCKREDIFSVSDFIDSTAMPRGRAGNPVSVTRLRRTGRTREPQAHPAPLELPRLRLTQ